MKKASWHNRCRSKIGKVVLNRKRKHCTSSASPAKTRRSIGSSYVSIQPSDVFFVCDGPPGSSGLRNVQTLSIDLKIRQHAELLCDKVLIRKLSSGDMVATECKYHLKCLSSFYRRKPKGHSVEIDAKDVSGHALAIEELVSYIEDFRDCTEYAPVTCLADRTIWCREQVSVCC